MDWDLDVVKRELCGPAGLVMVPFNKDLSLNVEALKGNIRYMMEGGMKTGQGYIICRCGSGRVPVTVATRTSTRGPVGH